MTPESPTAQSGPSALFLRDLQAVMQRHGVAALSYTTDDDGIHAHRNAGESWHLGWVTADDSPPAGARDAVTPDWRSDWLLDLMGEWDTPMPTGMFDAIVKRLPIAAITGKADGGDGFVLTMRSGVSSMNDNVIGTFRCYATALSVGGFLMEQDAKCAPEYQTFDIVRATQPAATGAVEGSDRVTPEMWQALDDANSLAAQVGIRSAERRARLTNTAAPGMGDARALFESWAKRRHGSSTEAWADSGEYKYQDTRRWWECWQAALAAQPAPVEAERGLHTNRREQAVQYMLAEGWKWDDSAWCREPTAQPAPVVGGVDGVARLLADAAGHGMREKCEPLARQIVELLAARTGGDEPDRALLVSMALRLNHGFGLDTPAQQERQILNMQQVWEEVAGKGFYSQQTRERYLAMDPEAHPAQAGGGRE